MPAPSRLALALLVLAGLAGIAGLATWAPRAAREARGWSAAQAIDALPPYLGVRALRAGRDPTRDEDLLAAFQAEELDLRPDVVSALYPATAPALLRPLAPDDWSGFVTWWRRLLLAGALVAGAAGGIAAVLGAGSRAGHGQGGQGVALAPRAVSAALAGAAVAALALPALQAVRLGQVNPLVAAGAGLALVALAVGASASAALALVASAGLKLVPLAGLLPLLVARRWRALAAAACGLAGMLAWTALQVPLPRVFAGIARTLAFERHSALHVVAGLAPGSAGWMHQALFARHHPLALLTLGLATVIAWRGRERPQALAGALALVLAWLAADSAALNELYLLLALPVFSWVLLWPLAPAAPRVGWAMAAALGAALGVVPRLGWPGPFAALVLGEALWLTVAVRAVREAGPLSRRGWALVAVAAFAAFAVVALEPRPPSYRGEVPAVVPHPPAREGLPPWP